MPKYELTIEEAKILVQMLDQISVKLVDAPKVLEIKQKLIVGGAN